MTVEEGKIQVFSLKSLREWMQNLPGRGVILVVTSRKIITPHMSKISISVHHCRRFIGCRTLSLQLWASEDQQVSAPNLQLYGACDKRYEVTLWPELINNSYLHGMSGKFHDKPGGNNAPLYEISRCCKAICMHACITCKKKNALRLRHRRPYLT
jgi:hypothetical protein